MIIRTRVSHFSIANLVREWVMALYDLWAYLILTLSKSFAKFWISDMTQKISVMLPCLLLTRLTTSWESDSITSHLSHAYPAICRPHSIASTSTKVTSPLNFEGLIAAAITFPSSSLITAHSPEIFFSKLVVASTFTLQ